MSKNVTTITNGSPATLTLADMLMVINHIKIKPPTIYAIDFKFLTSEYLPENTIIVSKDIGEELEKRGLITTRM